MRVLTKLEGVDGGGNVYLLMNVCMRVRNVCISCMHVGGYVHMYLCMFVFTYIRTSTFIYLNQRVYIQIR